MAPGGEREKEGPGPAKAAAPADASRPAPSVASPKVIERRVLGIEDSDIIVDLTPKDGVAEGVRGTPCGPARSGPPGAPKGGWGRNATAPFRPPRGRGSCRLRPPLAGRC